MQWGLTAIIVPERRSASKTSKLLRIQGYPQRIGRPGEWRCDHIWHRSGTADPNERAMRARPSGSGAFGDRWPDPPRLATHPDPAGSSGVEPRGIEPLTS